MSNNQLPSILNVRPLPSVDTMKIDTAVLDPITITQRQAVWQIPMNGILDGGSFVQLGLETAQGVTDAFLPVLTGIHACIDSVFLKIGSKVVASNVDYGHFQTAVRQLETPEHRAYVDMIKSGTCCDRWGQVGGLGRLAPRDLDYGTAQNAIATDNGAATTPLFIKPTDNTGTTALFSIPLSTLIPMMKSRQLPLFAIKESVYLEINFKTQNNTALQIGEMCCFPAAPGGSTAISISTVNTKFISDHLYYNDNSMAELQRQIYSENGLQYLYEDQITTNAQVPAFGAAGSQPIMREIAVSGRTCRNIIISDKQSGYNHQLCGQYVSNCNITNDEVNYRINDMRVFDRSLVSAPMKHDQLTLVADRPLRCPNQLYSYDVDVDKTVTPNAINQNSLYIGTIEGHALPNAAGVTTNADFRGISHYDGLDLTTGDKNVLGNGIKIGVKPIQMQKTYTRTPGLLQARDIRIFTNVERVMSIVNGVVSVSA